MTNFKLDNVTAEYVNKVAKAMADDINHGTKSLRPTVDRIAEDFGFEFAMWVMEKAKALVL